MKKECVPAEWRQDFVIDLSYDIDGGIARTEELLELGHSETIKLVQMYLHSARAKLQEYCTGYGLRYADDDGFTLVGDGSLKAGELRCEKVQGAEVRR